MSNMMCAIRSGCFTDYFLSPATVIRIMETIAATETDARREMLTVEAPRLLGFLALADDGSIRQVHAWGIDLADFPDADVDDHQKTPESEPARESSGGLHGLIELR
jgi:hypothetical protein